MLYLLFGSTTNPEGGASDFIGAYPTRDAANVAALASNAVQHARLSAWVHLVEFDGTTMKVTHWLNIPETEFDEHGELVWVSY